MRKSRFFLIMLLCLVMTAAAGCHAENTVLDLSDIGLVLTLPEAVEHIQGTFEVGLHGEVDLDTDFYYASFFYSAMPRKNYDAVMRDEDAPVDDLIDAARKMTTITDLFVVGGDRGIREFEKRWYADSTMRFDDRYLTELCRKDGYTWYSYRQPDSDYLKRLDAAYKDEYRFIRDALLSALKDNASFSVPHNEILWNDRKAIAEEFDTNAALTRMPETALFMWIPEFFEDRPLSDDEQAQGVIVRYDSSVGDSYVTMALRNNDEGDLLSWQKRVQAEGCENVKIYSVNGIPCLIFSRSADDTVHVLTLPESNDHALMFTFGSWSVPYDHEMIGAMIFSIQAGAEETKME